MSAIPRLPVFFRNRLTPFLNGVHGKPARRKLWLGILAALLFAVSLAVVKLVVLKMLAVRQQVRVSGGSRYAERHSAGADFRGDARDRCLPGYCAGSDGLRGLCRNCIAHQFQRTGTPVLSAQRILNRAISRSICRTSIIVRAAVTRSQPRCVSRSRRSPRCGGRK